MLVNSRVSSFTVTNLVFMSLGLYMLCSKRVMFSSAYNIPSSQTFGVNNIKKVDHVIHHKTNNQIPTKLVQAVANCIMYSNKQDKQDKQDKTRFLTDNPDDNKDPNIIPHTPDDDATQKARELIRIGAVYAREYG